MAEKLCTLRKSGGGKMKETVLWTNPSPTSDFAGATLTLSDNISHYKYIGIVGVYSKNATTDTLETIYSTDEIVNATSGNTCPCLCIAGYRSNTYYFRHGWYISDTTINFTNARSCTTSTAPSTVNGAMIPISVKGYK